MEETVRKAAQAYLARREHSRQELQAKLTQKYAAESVVRVLDSLQTEGLQSDARYTEAYIRSRAAKGHGPRRIERELNERGITAKLIDTYLDNHSQEWQILARNVRYKRFGSRPIRDIKEQAKQLRFMQYRGFDNEQIKFAFQDVEVSL